VGGFQTALFIVIAGPDPAIYSIYQRVSMRVMDARVKPGHDDSACRSVLDFFK
jgi:hypothetical protein